MKGTKADVEERRRDKQKVVFWSEWEGGTEGRKKVGRGGGEVREMQQRRRWGGGGGGGSITGGRRSE